MIISMMFLTPILADNSPPPNVPVGNNVSWETQQNTTQDSWNWNSQGWEFGPYPTFEIILQNGTVVNDANYIPLNQHFTIQIQVQKSVFVGNATLGQAGVLWYTNLMSENGSVTGNANCRMNYINSLQQQGWNRTNVWDVGSSIMNQTGDGNFGPGPGSGPMPPQQQNGGFYVFDPKSSNVTESDLGWTIYIAGLFNGTTPLGPYSASLQVTDQFNNQIDLTSQPSGTDNSPNRMVAVGEPGFIYGGLQDSWTLQKLDMQNNSVLSVAKGAEWKMRFNVTSAQFSNITVGLNMPWNIEEYVNVTDWYPQTVTDQGGWIYNQTSGTYYWNSTVSVTRTEQVYGPHLEQRWISLPNYNHEINVTMQQWNPATNTNQIITQTQWFQDQLYLIYDHATNSFSIEKGYVYSSFDPTKQQQVQYSVLSPINASDPASQFYSLSLADCKAYQTGADNYVVEFAGSFANATSYTQNQYYLQIAVCNKQGQIWANWNTVGADDFQIAVDTPVAVSTILDSQGNAATSMFQIDQGKPFTVQAKVYGVQTHAGGLSGIQGLDAIGVSFQSNFGTWRTNESLNSQLEIRLIKNLDTGALTSLTYNRTTLNKYVYGSYQGWAYVNVTDWHTAYNSTTGNWDWVDSPHLIWNQTTLTDWHWAYYVLNQTEYAINPNSPKIWIDITTTYVDNYDPAFLMPSSYATLNSASVTLTDGIVVANLGVTFNPTAPQGNYWYNMIYQNLTYGQDPSQGWGEHTITEWTNQPTYYINGTETNGQPLLVSPPTDPLYTIYNANRYLIQQVPYITIDGTNLLIQPQIQYNQAQQQQWIQYLLNGPYDPTLGRQTEYYQLINGTDIYVDQGYQTIIRTLQLNTNQVYEMVDGYPITLPNGTTIETYMSHASQDYSQQIQGVVPYYYATLNGTRVYLNAPFEQSIYNETTNHWELSNQVYSEKDTTLIVQSIGSGVLLNGNILVMLSAPGYWQPLPDGSGYYLVMLNGTRITIQNPWGVPDNQRIVTINGVDYTIGWPTQYYQATYQGKTLHVPNSGSDGDTYVQSYFYTDLGVTGGPRYELPYPGAMATSWWDLQGIQSTGQKLETLKSISIGGEDYLLNFDNSTNSYYIVVDGLREAVTYPTEDSNTLYSSINGQDYWNITQNGWILNYGTYSEESNQLVPAGNIITTTGFDQTQQTWSVNRYGYDYENSTMYLIMPNGTRLNVNSGMDLIVWKVQVGNQTYYTTNSQPSMESTTDAAGQTVYSNYFTTLDNQKIFFDWNNNPASWIQEIHIPIPGANYTTMIPFTWQPQTFFDKIVIYNITIPALSSDPTHTGVYFENGTEVAVGTHLKVVGSTYGPATCYAFAQNGNDYSFTGAYMPTTTWNNTQNVSYCYTLNGQRIYSFQQFGWNGNGWDPTRQQWQFYNLNAASDNRTVPVEQGGYAIYLNNTLQVDLASSTTYGYPNGYVVLTNGTHLNVQYISSLNQWFTTIGDNTYLFGGIVNYYKVTDSGVTYSTADPLVFDQRHMYTPSFSQAPTISTNTNTWLRMNSTTNSILQSGTSYYLVNASNDSRINLQLVNQWWNLSEMARSQVFTNQLSDYYPRFNVTINGVQYFVLNPSPVTSNWNGDWSVQQATYRYPTSMTISLGGKPYTIDLMQNGNWNNNLTISLIDSINLNGATYELDQQNNWEPSYQVIMNNHVVPIQLGAMNIYETHQSWGQVFTWRLTDLSVSTSAQVNNIIVGTPTNGMWGIEAYKTVPSTGAIALDGNLTNTSDQYFVREIHTGTDTENQTENRMLVGITWNPNSTLVGNKVHVDAWMGTLQVSWTTQWDEQYVWYRASDMSPVSSQEMAQIRNTVINNATGIPNPGYWDIAYMVQNQTWADVLAQAKANNWNWITNSANQYNWLWFGTNQNYNVNALSANGLSTSAVDLRYEFAGLSLYNGTQQTHYFMPSTIGNISFATPGQGFGDRDPSGSLTLPLDSTINFGVTYNNVNGTLFPYNDQRSMWGWWSSPIFGSDFNSPNFMNEPTPASIDQLAFTVHFGANQTSAASQYNTASMKIDQSVGNWNLPPDTVDGREVNSSGVMVPLTGNNVLTNRSLAINYYVTASTSMGWNVLDNTGQSIDNNNVTESPQFNVASLNSNVTFATVKLGSTYNWGKPTTATDQIRTFNVTSETTPIQNFQSSYQSDAGQSSTGFQISQSMYFLTQGFTRWDGYPIYNDPQVSLLLSKGTTYQPTQSPPPSQPPSSSQGSQPSSSPSGSNGGKSPTSTNNPPTPSTGPGVPPSSPNPQPAGQTAQPSPPSTPVQLPIAIIGIGIAVTLGVFIAVFMLVRSKKNRKVA